VLKARAEALDRIRQRAESSLAERAADRTALPRLARDLALALEYLGTAPAIIEAPASLLDDLRRTLSDASRVTLVPSSGRMIARSADGAVVVDASMERRFARAWPRLAIELSARLEALS
jgi:vacuolar-type H+-ATPase subunit E/Vma4